MRNQRLPDASCRCPTPVEATGAARWLLGLVLVGLCVEGLSAGEVRMRSGMVLPGAPRKLQNLTGRNDSRGNVTAYPVVMVNAGATRYFLSSKQVAEGGLNEDANLAKRELFRIKQHKTNPKSLTLGSIGLFADVSPFDKFGHRTVRLNTPREVISVHQGMTEITPDFVKLMGLNYNWDCAISTKSIPAEALEQVLRHRVDPQDSQLRLQLARFFIQAEMFPQAFKELEAIARDFPELKDKATSVYEGLMQEFGRVLLRELRLRVEAGQYRLADEYARQMVNERLGGAVQKDVQDFLRASDQRRDSIAKAGELLDELAGKLTETQHQSRLMQLRSLLVAELHPDSMNRLDPFLKSENGFTDAERLALAYSGWVLGAVNAVTELDQAIRLWDARFLLEEALRATEADERQDLYQKLRKVEGVSARTVRQLLPQIPPVVETPEIRPGVAFKVDVEPSDPELAFSYSVLLPIEYSPQHTYPVVVTLRAEGRTPENMLEWWGGSAELPGFSQRRGYIVIAPQYAPPEQGTYSYDSPTHARVLAALNDARSRFSIDSDRVFLSGHGMGADAAFDLGFTHPDEFAGVIPVCGVLDHYPKIYLENGLGTAWYVVGGELDRNLGSRNYAVFDKIMAAHGFKIDFLYSEFYQRGFENYAEELPRIFDWMTLHRRLPLPREISKMRTLRKADGRFFWVVANDLPKEVVLPAPAGQKSHVKPDLITARIAPGGASGNRIEVQSPASRHTLWIHPDLVDLEKRVTVKINSQHKLNDFVEQDAAVMLEDFRARGDRQRVYAAKLEF